MAREEFKVVGLEGVMRTLQQLPAEVVSKRGGPVRSALQKAAKLMQTGVQANVQKIIDQPNLDGLNVSTGLLKNNIVTKRGRLAGGEKGELYSVRVRNKRYPAERGAAGSTAQVARLLESGTERRDPMPIFRPAFEQYRGQVVALFVSELNKKLAAITKKLARQNGVA